MTRGFAMLHAADDLGEFVNHRHTRLPGDGRPLPKGLRWALELLSGYDMSEVRVFYASDVPAQVGARAITRGTDIHVEAGAEDTLAHEAWHVVQQMQGRVEPLVDINGMAVNDDPALEKEADAMGAMAAALSWTTMWGRAKGALAKVRIKKPVVQRHVLVNDSRYEAVANQDAHVKGMADFLRDIMNRADLTDNEIPEINTIARDLIAENREFANWIALAKEIEIRNVGYAVESTMRRMFESNRALDTEFVKKKEQKAETEEALEALDEKILRWTESSFPKYSYRDRQVVKWLLGERMDEPKRLNCWECVLFALVKTAPENVRKGYMTWAMEQVYVDAFRDFDPNQPAKFLLPRFYKELVAVMDYYFRRHGTPVLNEAKEQPTPGNNESNCFALPAPGTFVIPRGRVVLFDYAEHVAISTGKSLPIQEEYARGVFGRLNGHGILDLNVKGFTIRERTIEELVAPSFGVRNNQLVIAPFPICTESKTIELEGTVPPTQEEIAAYQKSINEEATAAYNRKVEKLNRDFEVAKARPKANVSALEVRHRTNLNTAKQQFDQAVIKAAAILAKKKIKSIDDVVPASKQENLELRYSPMDPYGGEARL